MESNNIQPNPKALAIVKALAFTENGGQPDLKNLKAGGSGEAKSIFQFMPDTWRQYSKQVFGNENTPLTPENESVVTYQKVNNWLNEGYDVNQIASMWNAGEQRPDAYKQGHKGKNTKGVMFDTPAYAKKVANYARQFELETGVTTSETGKETQPLAVSQTSKAPATTPGLITPKMKEAKQV